MTYSLTWCEGAYDRISSDSMTNEVKSELRDFFKKALKEKGMGAYAHFMDNDRLLESLDYGMSEMACQDVSDFIPGKVERIGGCDWCYAGFGTRLDGYYLSKEGKTWFFWLVSNTAEDEGNEAFRLIAAENSYQAKWRLAEDMLEYFYNNTRGSDWLGEADECGSASGGDILSSEDIQRIHDEHLRS